MKMKKVREMKKSAQENLAKILAATVFGVGFVAPLMFGGVAQAADYVITIGSNGAATSDPTGITGITLGTNNSFKGITGGSTADTDKISKISSVENTTAEVYGIYSQATNTINFSGSDSIIKVLGKYAYGIQLDDSEITTISNLGSVVAESTSGTARGVYLWNTTSNGTISLISFDETQGGSISAYSASGEPYGIYFGSTDSIESKVLNVNTISAGVSSTQAVSTGTVYGIYAGAGTNTLTFTGEAKSITAKTTGGYAYGIRYKSLGTMSVTNLSSVVAETTANNGDARGIAVIRDSGDETSATTLSVTMADGGSISAYSASGENYGIEVTNSAGTYKVENVNVISAGVSSFEAVTSGEAYGIYVQGGINIVTFAGTDKLITAKSAGSNVYGVAAGCYYPFTGLLSVSNLSSIATVANNGSACGTFVYNRNSADSESATFSLSMSDGIISAYSANVDNCGMYFKSGSTGKSAVTNVNRIESGFKDASTITSGTAFGIYVGGGINTVTFAGTDSSITARTTLGTAYGIMVEGGDNQITGLKTINAESTSGTAYGIYVSGEDFSLNDVDTITATSTSGIAYGIYVNGGSLSGIKTITATSASGTAYGIYAKGGNTTIIGTSIDDKTIINGGICVDGTPATGEEIYTPETAKDNPSDFSVKQTTWKQADGKYLLDDSNAVTLTNTAINGNIEVKGGTLNLTDSTLNGNLTLAGGGTYSFQGVMSMYLYGSWQEIDKDVADYFKVEGYIDTEYPEPITSDNVTCSRNANLTNVTVTGDVEVSDNATLNLNGLTTLRAATVTFASGSDLTLSDAQKYNENVAISGITSATVARDSALTLKNTKRRGVYHILSSEIENTLTAANTWAGEKVTNDTALKSVVLLSEDGKTYDVQVGYDLSGSVAYNTFTAMDGADGTMAQDYMTMVTNEANSEVAQNINLNRLADMPEQLGVIHGQYVANNLTESAVGYHLTLNNKSEGMDIWAEAIHNKEHVDGLGLATQGNSYTAQYNGAVVGVDLLKKERTTLGVALTYLDGRISGTAGKNDSEYYGATLYGRTEMGKDFGLLYDMTFTRGKNDLQLNSGCSYDQITGAQQVSSFSVGTRVDKKYTFGQTSITPHLGARWLRLDGGSFTNSLGMSYDSESTDTLIVPIGLCFKANHDSAGWKMSFLADGGYQWNLGDRDYKNMVNYNGSKNSFNSDFADKNAWYAGAGLEFNRNNLTSGIGYRYCKSDSTKQNRWFANVIYSF